MVAAGPQPDDHLLASRPQRCGYGCRGRAADGLRAEPTRRASRGERHEHAQHEQQRERTQYADGRAAPRLRRSAVGHHHLRRQVRPTRHGRAQRGRVCDGGQDACAKSRRCRRKRGRHRARESDRERRHVRSSPDANGVRRLQGFPDGWTAIPWKGKPAAYCPDGPRYKALGNSMAVPVIRWIARKIESALP